MQTKIFIICPVREVTEEEKQYIQKYVNDLESVGCKVHWPQRDTNQIDPSGGLQICKDNMIAIYNATEIHVFWNGKSQGSLFDLGMAFILNQLHGKPIRLINSIDRTQEKSFNNVLLNLN